MEPGAWFTAVSVDWETCYTVVCCRSGGRRGGVIRRKLGLGLSNDQRTTICIFHHLLTTTCPPPYHVLALLTYKGTIPGSENQLAQRTMGCLRLQQFERETPKQGEFKTRTPVTESSHACTTQPEPLFLALRLYSWGLYRVIVGLSLALCSAPESFTPMGLLRNQPAWFVPGLVDNPNFRFPGVAPRAA